MDTCITTFAPGRMQFDVRLRKGFQKRPLLCQGPPKRPPDPRSGPHHLQRPLPHPNRPHAVVQAARAQPPLRNLKAAPLP